MQILFDQRNLHIRALTEENETSASLPICSSLEHTWAWQSHDKELGRKDSVYEVGVYCPAQFYLSSLIEK